MNDFFPGEGRKKITSLFSNQHRYNRSGTITTANIDKEDPLKTSRIMNLPNYRKDTLDSRLDFVVVFQTIEIERLSVEIESLRVRLADRQRQIFNYKNYEVQIKQLTERCFAFQKERSQFQNKISALMDSLRQTQQESDNFKEKCMTLEDALREQEDAMFSLKQNLIIERKQREQLQEGRLMLESSIKQKEKLYSRQLRDMQKSTQFKRTELTKNQEHLGNLLKKYHEEVNTLQKENIKLRNLYDSIQQQSHDLERRYQQLQEELYRNNELLKEKDFELEGAQHENRERMEIIQQRYEEEYHKKCQRLEDCEQEINEWKAQVDKLEGQHQKYQLKLAEYAQQSERYQLLLNEAGDQIDRLNTIIKDKIKYLQAWETRYKDLQENYHKTEENLNSRAQKTAVDQQEIMRLSHALKYKTEQLDKLEKTREQEARAVKEKLQEIEVSRQEIAAIKWQKQLEREEQKRKQLQNVQLKQQLNKRIIQGNKLFEDLNKSEVEMKRIKQQLIANQGALRSKQEELRMAKGEIASIDTRIEKLQNQKRALEQDVMRIKALEQRIRHQQSKKNEYMNEGKKLGYKLKETEKQLGESNRQIYELETELQKFERYTEQLIAKVTELQKKLQLLEQLKRQLIALDQKNQSLQSQILNLKQTIDKKIAEVSACKERIHQFEKYMKEFKAREESFKEQLVISQRLDGQLKKLRAKYEALEDKKDQLQNDLSTALAEIENLAKENGSLERVIDINTQQIQRGEKLLAEAKQDILSHKDREKELIMKFKESERRIKHLQQQFDQERDRFAKEKQDAEKLFQKKIKQFEGEFKGFQSQKDKLLLQKEKELKESEVVRGQLSEQNNSFRILFKKYQEQKDKLNKNSKQLERKITNYEHEIDRLTESGNEARKELEIALKNIDSATGKTKQSQTLLKEQAERIQEMLKERERLLAEIADCERVIAGKEQDNAHLLRENQLYQKQMLSLRDEFETEHQKNTQLCAQLINVKFQAESVTAEYKGLKVRLANMEKMLSQLKGQLSQIIQLGLKLEEEKKQLQKKHADYQQRLSAEIDRLEEQQFKAGEENIRLQSLNRLLQIELGEYRERQVAVFSIVKESSMLKERKDASPSPDLKKRIKTEIERPIQKIVKKPSIAESRGLQKSSLKESQRLLKSSIFGDGTPTKKSRCGTTRLQEQGVDTSYCEKRDSGKGEGGLRGSKNRVYFQNLVFKQN